MGDSKLRRIRDRSSGPATLISEGCKVTGALSGTGDFMVNGEVDGDCDIEGSLTLAPDGRWRGTMKAGAIIVAGTVEGDVVSTGSVEIVATARINGTVTGESIAVAVGAVVEGVMKTTGRGQPTEFVEKRQTTRGSS